MPPSPHCAFQDGRNWQHTLLTKPFQTVQSLRANRDQALSGQELHDWPWACPVLVGGIYSICSSSSLGAGRLKPAGRAKAAKPLIRAKEWLHICSHAAHSYQGKTSTREWLLRQLQGKGLLLSWTFPAASNFTPVLLFCGLFVCFCFCSLFDLLCLHLEWKLLCKHVLKGIWFYNIIMQTQSLREIDWKKEKKKILLLRYYLDMSVSTDLPWMHLTLWTVYFQMANKLQLMLCVFQP